MVRKFSAGSRKDMGVTNNNNIIPELGGLQNHSNNNGLK